VHPDSCAAWAPFMQPTVLTVLGAGSDCVATASFYASVYARADTCTVVVAGPMNALNISRSELSFQLLACMLL
jgi:hypothetical protein